MAHDRYTKLELQIRLTFRDFWLKKLASGRKKVVYLPQVEVPRGETVDLFLAPDGGTTICLSARSDYVMVYRHTVGQMLGTLTHYHQMDNRQLREAVRTARSHPDTEDIKQGRINVLNTAKRLAADQEAGQITVVLVTEVPEVPQQGHELGANVLPILAHLQKWLVAPVKGKQRLCQAVKAFAVTLGDEPKVTALDKALAPMIKKDS